MLAVEVIVPVAVDHFKDRPALHRVLPHRTLPHARFLPLVNGQCARPPPAPAESAAPLQDSVRRDAAPYARKRSNANFQPDPVFKDQHQQPAKCGWRPRRRQQGMFVYRPPCPRRWRGVSVPQMGEGRPARIRVSVRFPPTSHRIVAAAAEREGLSMSEYIREAALMRVAFEMAAQAGGTGQGELAEALRALRDELRAERDQAGR